MGPNSSSGDHPDLRELDVLDALRVSSGELERASAALADAERELDAAEAALRRGAAPEVRDAIEALLPELGPSLVLDADDQVVARAPALDAPGVALPAPDVLAEVARDARAGAPAPVRRGALRAVAVGRSDPLVVVRMDPSG